MIPHPRRNLSASFGDERWGAKPWDDLAGPLRQKMVRHPSYFPTAQGSRSIASRPGGRVLDCGCGMGEWTVQLAEEGIDVVGIDIAARRISNT